MCLIEEGATSAVPYSTDELGLGTSDLIFCVCFFVCRWWMTRAATEGRGGRTAAGAVRTAARSASGGDGEQPSDDGAAQQERPAAAKGGAAARSGPPLGTRPAAAGSGRGHLDQGPHQESTLFYFYSFIDTFLFQ